MNNIVTSKEEILRVSRELIKKRGLNSINMRSLALDLYTIILNPKRNLL